MSRSTYLTSLFLALMGSACDPAEDKCAQAQCGETSEVASASSTTLPVHDPNVSSTTSLHTAEKPSLDPTSEACSDLFAPRTVELDCSSGAERCEIAKDSPDREFSFSLRFNEHETIKSDPVADNVSATDDEITRRTDCLTTALESVDIQEYSTFSSIPFIMFDGTYSQLEGILDYEVVTGVEISCIEECIETCSSHSVDDCESNPFCSLEYGSPISVENECTGEAIALGCTATDLACPPEVVTGVNPEGECYEFASGCVPNGFDEINGEDADKVTCPTDFNSCE